MKSSFNKNILRFGTIEYVGDYYKNTRNGNGKLYDKKNECIYDGEWSNNSPLKERSIV